MRDIATIKSELAAARGKADALKATLAEHERALEPRITPINDRLEKKKSEKRLLNEPSASPIFTVIACIMLATAIINMIWLGIPYLTLAAFILAAVFFIIKAIMTAALRKPYKEQLSKIEAEISAIEEEIDKVESSDPELKKLRAEISEIEESIDKLETERGDHDMLEKMGENNLIICLNNEKSRHTYYYDNDFKYSKFYAGTVIVDGKECGTIASPCSIIPMSPGIHSLEVRLDPHADATFTTTPSQFSTSGGNYFVSIKNVETTSNAVVAKQLGGAFNADIYKGKDISCFLSHSGMTREELRAFVRSL